MARLAHGDRRALDEVYAHLAPEVRGFCRGVLRGAPDADDAAQDALVKLFGQLDAYDPQRDALAWALTIAAFECRTVRRRASRSRTGSLAAEPSSDAPGADVVLEHEARVTAALTAVDGLRPEDRAVLEDVLEGRTGDAAFRKRKQRMVDRLRALVGRVYDLDA